MSLWLAKKEQSSSTATPSASVRVVIGLDYGTSSTKVALRVDDQPAEVIALDDGCSGFEWFATPSSIRLDQDAVWLGSASQTTRGGRLLQNLKVLLLGDGEHAPQGVAPEEADFLVAAHLLWCLRGIRARLDKRMGAGRYRPSIHVAAPMTHVGDPHRTRRYDRILNAAITVAFSGQLVEARQPASKAELHRLLAPLLHPDHTLPEPEARNFRVSPETLAPFISLLRDRMARNGMYLLVDVGAATTEALLVRLLEPDASNRRFVCYADATKTIGGNNFQGSNPNAAAKALGLHIQRTLFEAFNKDRYAATKERWRDLCLLQSGGGIMLGGVREVLFQETWREKAMLNFDARLRRTLHSPSAEDLVISQTKPKGQAATRKNFHMLANAHGLSVHWRKWDGWHAPDDVETLPDDREQTQPRHDTEDD